MVRSIESKYKSTLDHPVVRMSLLALKAKAMTAPILWSPALLKAIAKPLQKNKKYLDCSFIIPQYDKLKFGCQYVYQRFTN